MSLLNLQGLTIAFRGPAGPRRVLHDLSFKLQSGETLVIVGESGSGKTVACLALMGLLQEGIAFVEQGNAYWGNIDLLQSSPRALRGLYGRKISMVFQDPGNSLNPYLTVGTQLIETLTPLGLSIREAAQRSIEALEAVGIADAAARLRDYPHVLSGGMRQRVMIAMAVMNRPQLLIADEPTTALDVTIQSQILSLLQSIQRDLGMGMIIVTHDLGVAARLADQLIILKQGHVVEAGLAAQIFDNPQSDYTRHLLQCVPQLP